MFKKMGHDSRLVTFHKNPYGLPEDICVDFYLPRNPFAMNWRRKKVGLREKQLKTNHLAREFSPGNLFEQTFFYLRDLLRRGRVNKLISDNLLDSFDIVFYHGGLDFYRYPHQALRWKSAGKKIVCFYHGSDLRIRGYIKELDSAADLNLTSEYDLLTMKENLGYCFYPYDSSELPDRKTHNNDPIRIVHSPTNRRYKGTDLIISVIEKIKDERNIEFLLLEGIPRKEVLEIKAGCDICIDQVGGEMGGTGYGKSGIESLAMGLPTITNMTDEYQNWLPDNPFVVCNNSAELYNKLIWLIDDSSVREAIGGQGKIWVKKYHGYESVYNHLSSLFTDKRIIPA